MTESRYPVPGPKGGRLIRETIAGFRAAGLRLPITSDILLAVSAGSDSTALAHLLAKYGRRVIARERIVLLHVNHGWRGATSDGDEAFVRALAKRLGVRSVARAAKKAAAAGRSREEAARELRHAIFARESARLAGAPVVTAHHADDLAETVLWRLLTGAARTHGAGIVARHGVQLRPWLKVRKAVLQQYLREEGEAWREDSTNSEGILLRSRLRGELLPAIEKLFPRAVEHLVELATGVASVGRDAGRDRAPLEALASVFGSLGLRVRRPQWQALAREAGGEQVLPGGWRARREHDSRWVIERVSADDETRSHLAHKY